MSDECGLAKRQLGGCTHYSQGWAVTLLLLYNAIFSFLFLATVLELLCNCHLSAV